MITYLPIHTLFPSYSITFVNNLVINRFCYFFPLSYVPTWSSFYLSIYLSIYLSVYLLQYLRWNITVRCCSFQWDPKDLLQPLHILVTICCDIQIIMLANIAMGRNNILISCNAHCFPLWWKMAVTTHYLWSSRTSNLCLPSHSVLHHVFGPALTSVLSLCSVHLCLDNKAQ